MSFGYQVLGFGSGGGAAAATVNDNGIFAYGEPTYAMSNLVSNLGVVATDVTGLGTGRTAPSGCEYGGDKGIMAFGTIQAGGQVSISNLVSNTGVVATDTAGVGTAREQSTGCEYGSDTGIIGYGQTSIRVSMTNLISNTGVVSGDVTGVGSARRGLAACSFGGDKGIFGFGELPYPGPPTNTAITNLVSNTGVVATDTTGVGTARQNLAEAI